MKCRRCLESWEPVIWADIRLRMNGGGVEVVPDADSRAHTKCIHCGTRHEFRAEARLSTRDAAAASVPHRCPHCGADTYKLAVHIETVSGGFHYDNADLICSSCQRPVASGDTCRPAALIEELNLYPIEPRLDFTGGIVDHPAVPA
ncbi:MAG: phage terminase large subunit family protein [Deltaproteobacteria bacterium]|nr:phage terminase large subunit family protein [Deltaproteobacteria bacterium]